MSEVDKFFESYGKQPASTPAAQASEVDELAKSAPSKDRGIGGLARDVAAWGVKGAIAVPEMAVGLADIVTGGQAGKFLENKGGAVGFRPAEAKELVNEWHSDATKDAQRKFQEAEGFGGKFQAAIENPSNIVGTVFESLPLMGGGALAARGLMGVTRLGQMGAKASAAATAAGESATAAATAGRIAATKGAGIAGAVGEGLTMAGSQAEAIRQETDDGLLTGGQTGAALATGVAGAAFGYGGARLASKLGVGDINTMLAQGGARGAARTAAEGAEATAGAVATKGIPRSVIEGAISEGLFEELPQSLSEGILKNLALDKPWTEGLDEAAVLGILAGAAMGGPAAGVHAYGKKQAAIETAVEELPEHQQAAARAKLNAELAAEAQQQAQARAAALNDEEAGQPDMTQPAPPPAPPPAWATPPEGATADSYNPDDEIAQSTGANQPSMHPVRAAVQAAADAGGSLSAAAGVAIDSGASPIPAYMPSAEAAPAPDPVAPPVVLQNRDRTSQASIAQMQEIASNPEYLLTGPSREMTSGAPVVFGDLPPTALMGRAETVMDGKGGKVQTQYAVVDAGDLIPSNNADGTTVQEYATGVPGKLRAVAGNGRTAGIQAAYGNSTAQQYQQDMANDAESLGIDPASVMGMQRPVLVRVMSGADVTGDMGDRTNVASTQKLSPTEQAGNDMRRLDLRSVSFDANGEPTMDALKGFVASMPVAERGDMLNGDGTPTRQAVDRLMAATFKQAYDSDELVQLYAQATDPDARAVMGAAADAAGVMANLKGAGEFDVRAAVADAAKMAVNATRQGAKLADVLKNQDIDMNPDAYPVAKFMADNVRSPKRMAEGLRRWGQLALEQARIAEENKAQGNLLGDPTPTLSRAQLFAALGSDSNPTDQSITAPQAAPEPAAQQAEIAPERREPRSPLPARGVLAKLAQARIAKKAAEAKAADAQAKPEAAPPAPTGDKLKTNIFGLPDGVNFLSGTQAVPASSLEVGDWVVIDSKINSVEAVTPMDGQRLSLGLRSAEGRYAITVDADTTMQRKMVEGETFTPEDGTPEALFGDLQQGLEAIKTGMSQRPAPQAEAAQEESPKPLNVIERERQRQEAAKAEAAPEAAPLELTGQTAEQARAEADAQDAADKAKAKADAAADAADKARRDKADVDARMEASADNFMLGQDANDAVSGQASVFDAPAQPTTTQGATNAQEATQPKQDGAQQAKAGTAQDAVTPAQERRIAEAEAESSDMAEAKKQKARAEQEKDEALYVDAELKMQRAWLKIAEINEAAGKEAGGDAKKLKEFQDSVAFFRDEVSRAEGEVERVKQKQAATKPSAEELAATPRLAEAQEAIRLLQQRKDARGNVATSPEPAADLDAMFDDLLAEEIAKDEKPAKAPAPKATKPEAAQQPTQAPPPRTAGQAASSAAKNSAAALGNAIDGLGALFGGAGKLGSGLSFDEQTYAKAKPLFQQAIANVSDAGTDLKDLMRAVIRMVLDKFGVQAAQNMKPYVTQFIADVEAERNNDNQESQDVPDTDARVERDSQVPATEPAVGDAVSTDAGATAEGAGETGGRASGKSGSGQQDGAGVPFGSAPVAGERGDQRVHTGEPVPELESIAAGTEFGERSGDDGVGGVPPDNIPAGKVEATAEPSVDPVKAGIERARANKAPVKLGDIDSIKATLPQLHPGQQEDVQKAEKRFADPNGYGMLFTNGTGTGKTFSGLGVVKRFALQGKTNALIVVPDDKIASDWIESAKLLGLDVSKLENTKDAGKGIVITSYANLGENDALAGRNWDLVVADEAHTLMQSADGVETGYLRNLRAITHHPDGVSTRHSMQNRDKLAQRKELIDRRAANIKIMNSDDTMDAMVDSLRAENAKLDPQIKALTKELDDAREALQAEVDAMQGAGRARLVALSATPFAYEKTVDWANGYLFDYKDGYPHNENSTVYNQPDPREYFFQTRFGYRMRVGKLTAPDANVDSGLMQRQFNGELKKSGALSGRMLDVPHDYDRRFVLVDSAIGNQIDEALEWLNEQRHSAEKGNSGASELAGVINEQFKYLQKRYLLEAIKASEAVPIIKQHMALGRKVVVFHDYKKGGALNPFKVSPLPIRAGVEPPVANVQFNQAIEAFNAKFADLINHPLLDGADSPIEVFSRELPGTLFVNGNEKKADLLARYKSFQDDATGPQVMLVQSAKNKGWSGHDTTGKHQRVLINLGQPTAPTMAVQQEGRIYRTGQASDAIMRYMNTGTNWERWTFASTIASRASTAENLGMGEQARALKDSFINAFEQSDTYAPGHEGEGKGGKEQDAAANNALTEYDRAKSLYFANEKKTSRTKAAEGVDYFATPEPVGLKMVEWLDVRSGEDVLEPSGGHGAIARWFPEKSNKTVIEPSLALRSRLALAMNAQEDRLLDGTFEDHNVVNKYDGIVMNPPFGVGGKTAIEHLAKAATHLRDGGRIVALIPTGQMADKRFDKWMNEKSERAIKPVGTISINGVATPVYKGDTIATSASWSPSGVVRSFSEAYGVGVDVPGKNGVVSVSEKSIVSIKATGRRTEEYNATADLHLVAEVLLPASTFERAGTGVMTRIVIIEKQTKPENAPAPTTRSTKLLNAKNVKELFDDLEDFRFPPRPKVDAVAEAPKEKPAKAAAKARAEKAKAQTVGAGAIVKLGSKTYEVAIYTTNAGKELRGVWMATRAEASEFTNSPFQKRPLGWFVRESNFPAGAVQQGDSTAAYSEAQPAQKKTATALDKQIMGMANDGRSARDILRTILAESDSKLNRQVAALLLKMQAVPKVEAVGRIYNGRGHLVSGVHNGKTDTVQLSLLFEAGAEYTFMHEMVHAATIQSLRRGGLAAQRMKALFARVQKDKVLAGEYGVTDVYEFAAEVYSNPRFRAALNSTSGNSMWQEFVNIVRSILGLSTDQTTALGKAMLAGQQVMNEDKAIRARTAERAGGEFSSAPMDVDSNEIRFSRAAEKEVRNLVTLHNIAEAGLMRAGELGGLPVPSIGITKVDSPFGGFGSITLIAPKGMIDPDSGVPVYDRDAWTARFPEMNFKKAKAKAADALYDKLLPMREMPSGDGGFMSLLRETTRDANTQSPSKMLDLFSNYEAPRIMYARDVLGKNVKVPMRQVPITYSFISTDLARHLIKNKKELLGDGTPEQETAAVANLIPILSKAINDYVATLPETAQKSINRVWRKRIFSEDGSMTTRALDALVKDADVIGKNEVDKLSLKAAVDKVVASDDPGYIKWAQDLIAPLFDAPTITLRGKQVEPTMDNIVDAMTTGATAGAEKSMTFGAGKASAMLGKQFKSLAEIKAARNQVVSDGDEETEKKTTQARLDEYSSHIAQFYTEKDWRGKIDTWAAESASREALANSGKSAATDANMRAALSKMGFKGVDRQALDLMAQAVTALRNAATNYFEAKPQRAVKLNEFAGAVVPKGTSAEAIALLESNGVEVVIHSKTEGAREKAIQKLATKLDKKNKDVLFSTDAAQAAAPASQPRATTAAIRQSLSKAYGKLAEQLEQRGLVTLTQTQEQAIDAAAQARAAKTGESVEAIKQSLMDSVDIKRSADGNVQGFFDPQSGQAFLVADNLTAEAAPGVLMHEVGIHMAADKTLAPLFNRAKMLLKAQRGNAFMQRVQAKLDAAGETSAEEAAAYMVEAYESDRTAAPASVGKWLSDLLASVKAWMHRKGVLGADRLTVADIAAVARANAKSLAQGQSADGKVKFSRASGADQTQTEAFKKWFAGSKVVDADGKPLVVYHGTGADFSVFLDEKIGSSWGADRIGHFFTSDAKVAGDYANASGPTAQRTNGQNIKPVYLKIERPVSIEALEAFSGLDGLEEKYESPIELYDDMRDDIESMLLGNAGDNWTINKESKASTKNTHDGILITIGNETLAVVVDGRQIKSSTGNNGDFDGSNPDIRFSRSAAAIDSSMGAMTPEQEAAYKRVAGTKKVPTLKERFAMLKANFGLKARQALVDQFAAIKQLDQNAYMQARMSKGSDGALEATLLYGKPFLKDGVPDVDITDGGFAKVLASLNGEHDRWMMWVAAQRAERLMAEGKENLMTDDDISALKSLSDGDMPNGSQRAPAYDAALKELNDYNEAMLKMAQESGLIDQETVDLMSGQPYVPFYRLMEDADFEGPRFSSGLKNQQAWKKLKGGTQQLNADLLQNTLMNWSHLLQASARNRAALATMDAAEGLAIAYKVPATTNGKATKDAVKVMRDGQTEHWMVEDPYLLEAVSALNYTVSPLMKPLTKMKQILTMAVTVNPTFKIRNLIRDSVSAIAQSDLGYNPVANVGNAWKLTAGDSQIYASMLAGGGIIKFGTQENTDRLRKQVEKLGGQVLDKKGMDKLMGQVGSLWDAYNEFGDRTENVNRVALYEQLMKKDHTHAEASFMARDLMDFSMGGAMPLVRFLTQTVPFLNARLVGLDKLGRSAIDNPRKFGIVAAAVSLASVALLAMYGDDDDWKEREDWDRDTYWWFKVGDTAYRIPKPFEVGAIGTMAERTAELMFSDEMTGKRFAERMGHMLSHTFAFDPVPQAVKPLLDVYSNKDSFTKRAIETPSEQRMKPADRYNERTSETAKLLGQLGLPEPSQLIKGTYVGMSPKQIDHLIRGYFSWVGVTATAAADMAVRPMLDKGERPDMQLRDTFLIGNFAQDLPSGSSRYVTQMYEQSRQIEQAYASYRNALKLGDTEKAQDIKASAGDKLRYRMAFAHATKRISELNQQSKRIEADANMSGAEKRQKLDDIAKRRNDLAKRTSDMAR